MSMGGKGGGGAKPGGYQSPTQFSDLSPGQIGGMGLNLPQLDVGGLGSQVEKGRLLTGQKIPTYQASKKFGFQAPDVSGLVGSLRAAPQRAYQGALDVGQENIMRGAQRAGAQASRAMGARGMGRSGLLGGAQTDIARQSGQQMADLTRQSSFQQAQDQMRMQQAAAQMGLRGEEMGLQTQGMQAGENARRAMESLQAQQALTGLQGQQIGMLSGLQQAGTQQAMAPFNMLSGLYGQNTGIPFQPSSGAGEGKNPFGSIMQGAGAGAKAMCLPKGTMISMTGGKKCVDDVCIGDYTEEGGKVIAVIFRVRHKGHKFFEHEFESGKVVMSLGHPFFDQILDVKRIDEHPSIYTYDILTEKGFYFVNGVKLGSTIK